MTIRRAVAAILIVAGSVSACSDAPSPTRAPGARGGDLTYLDAEAPASLQIQVGYWQNSLLKDQMLDRLVYQDPKTFDFVPWIAQKWTVDPSKRIYEFTIRDGASYSNGQPVDAESVRRNLEWEAKGDKDKASRATPTSRRSTRSRPTPHAAPSASRCASRTRRSSRCCR